MKPITDAQKRKPPLDDSGEPVWYHHHGSKMEIIRLDKNKAQMSISSGSAAKLGITREGKAIQDGWLVNWEIKYGGGAKVDGKIWMDNHTLVTAFGLINNLTGEFGDDLIEIYGADTAQQGKYIRWGKFLNIPGPGTGHDGDANISLEIYPETQEAIEKLLAL